MSRFTRTSFAVAAAAALILACNDDDNDITNSVPEQGLTLSVSNAAVSAPAGTPVNTTIRVTRVGTFNGAVTLTASGMPNGVTAGFLPEFVADTGSTSTLTLASIATHPVGTSTITVTGSGTGVAPATVQVQFTVLPPLSAIRKD